MTDAFSITRPDVALPKIETMLDPDFAKDLIVSAHDYAVAMSEADNAQWIIAKLTHENWDEHRSIFPLSIQYYAECSRVANQAYKIKMFGESGETLRRWVQVYERYEKNPKANYYLDNSSFDAMYKAVKLMRDEKVKSTDEALQWLIDNKASADDMVFHFDPPQPPNPYETMKGKVESLMSKDAWKDVLKDVKNVKRCVELASQMAQIMKEDK